MKKSVYAVIPLFVALAGSPGWAAEGAADIQQFKPVSDVGGFVLLHDATQLPQFRPGFSLTFNYAHQPLEVQAEGFGRQFGITDGIFGADLTAAVGLFDWWELGMHFPLMQLPFETSFITNAGAEAVGYGIGDLRIETRLRALDPERFPVGLSGNLFLTLPTGHSTANLGRGKPGGGFRVALSQAWTRIHFAVNLGYAFYPRATIANLTTDDEFTYGVGLGFTPIVDHLDVRLELDGSFTGGPNDRSEAERFGNPAHSPLEFLGSVHYRFDFGLAIYGGLGKGLTPGFGSPAVRAFVGVSWANFGPRDRDKDGLVEPDDECPKDPEDIDGFQDSDGCPDPDNDADGVADSQDSCPDDAEDADSFNDLDGCPDPDNDNDGVLDAQDACPMEAEDPDSFEDNDGCPDPDNDGDGILDDVDSCPDEAETFDGWIDDDGCPDPDNDGDGRLDDDDLCPNRSEELNGVRDDDGCPDDVVVVHKNDALVLLKPLAFKKWQARFDRGAESVLAKVAELLRQTPAIKEVRIEAHTSNGGKASVNQRLSDKRARLVLRTLVKLGVEAERLQSAGYGGARPVASNRTATGRNTNRRIEFAILAQEMPTRAALPASQTSPAPSQPNAPVELLRPSTSLWGTSPPTGEEDTKPKPKKDPWSDPDKPSDSEDSELNTPSDTPWGN